MTKLQSQKPILLLCNFILIIWCFKPLFCSLFQRARSLNKYSFSYLMLLIFIWVILFPYLILASRNKNDGWNINIVTSAPLNFLTCIWNTHILTMQRLGVDFTKVLTTKVDRISHEQFSILTINLSRNFFWEIDSYLVNLWF